MVDKIWGILHLFVYVHRDRVQETVQYGAFYTVVFVVLSFSKKMSYFRVIASIIANREMEGQEAFAFVNFMDSDDDKGALIRCLVWVGLLCIGGGLCEVVLLNTLYLVILHYAIFFCYCDSRVHLKHLQHYLVMLSNIGHRFPLCMLVWSPEI